MKIGKRLAIGFGVLMALSLITGAAGIMRLQASSESIKTVMNVPLAKERLISDWYRNISGGVLRTKAIAKSGDSAMKAVFAEDAAQSAKTSDELRKKIEPLLEPGEEKGLYEEILRRRKTYVDMRERISDLKAAGNFAEADKLFDAEFILASKAYLNAVHDLVDMQRNRMNKEVGYVETMALHSRNFLILLSVGILMFGGLCAHYLTRSITRPLQSASDVARRVACGDLSGEIIVTGKDETAALLSALKDMNGSLGTIVSNVRHGTEMIATASQQVASGSQDMAARTEQQAASIEETASAMEELTTTVQRNAENAGAAHRLAGAASAVALKGGEIVAQVVNTMETIKASSRQIAEITGVIDSIAFQTNILALNAAVEAARAGEHGRGFAVVAGDVRNLAQRAASATREIKGLIDASVEQVAEGSGLVTKAGDTMKEIVSSVRHVTDLMAEISTITREQASGIEQIHRAIQDIEQFTQQDAALVEQAAAAAELMRQQSMHLAETVSVFRLK